MPRYTVFITRTKTIAIEVNADSPEEADALAVDKLSADPDDVDVIDSEDVIDYMEDDQRQTYNWASRRGEWQKQTQNAKR